MTLCRCVVSAIFGEYLQGRKMELLIEDIYRDWLSMTVSDKCGLVYGCSCILNLWLTPLVCVLVGWTDKRGITDIDDATIGCFVAWLGGPTVTIIFSCLIVWMAYRLIKERKRETG